MNDNPTKCATTVCTNETNLGPMLCSNVRPNNRLAVAARMRGFPNCPGNISNARVVVSVGRRTTHFNTSLHSKDVSGISFSSHPCRLASRHNGRVRTSAIVVTANTSTGCLNLTSRRGCHKRNISTYTAYSNFFCHGHAITMMNNNSATYRRTVCLSNLTGGICVVIHGPCLHTSRVVRGHIGRGRGVRVLFRSGALNLFKRGKMRNTRLIHRVNRTGRRGFSVTVSNFFLTVNRGPGASLFGSFVSLSRRKFVGIIPNATDAGLPNVFTTNSITSPICHRNVITTNSNTGTTVRTSECLRRLWSQGLWGLSGGRVHEDLRWLSTSFFM